MLDCSRTNRERELGLDLHETGYFYPTNDSVTIVIQHSTRGIVDLYNWSSCLVEKPMAQNYIVLDYELTLLSQNPGYKRHVHRTLDC